MNINQQHVCDKAMQEKEESITDKLTRHLWITYKSRYNAHRRLLTADRLQKFTLTTISVYILAISVLIIKPDILGLSKSSLINIYLVILSIMSLALSLAMGQADNKAKALEFHKCARMLQRLYDHILIEKQKNKEYFITSEIDKYNNILDRFDINHDRLDWEYHVYENWKENNRNIFGLFLFRLKYFVMTKIIYIALIVLPIGSGIYIIFN